MAVRNSRMVRKVKAEAWMWVPLYLLIGFIFIHKLPYSKKEIMDVEAHPAGRLFSLLLVLVFWPIVLVMMTIGLVMKLLN